MSKQIHIIIDSHGRVLNAFSYKMQASGSNRVFKNNQIVEVKPEVKSRLKDYPEGCFELDIEATDSNIGVLRCSQENWKYRNGEVHRV